MNTQAYVELRERVRKHLEARARVYFTGRLKTGVIALRAYEANVKFRSDIDAVDWALENAAAYGAWCETPITEDVSIDYRVRGMCDYAAMMLGTSEAENQQAAAFWDAVASSFEAFREEHCDQLARRASAILRHLERFAGEMPQDRVVMWARYGQALDEESTALRTTETEA